MSIIKHVTLQILLLMTFGKTLVIRRMRVACWITKATETHTLRMYNAYCLCTETMDTQKHLDVSSQYTVCLVFLQCKLTYIHTATYIKRETAALYRSIFLTII